MADKQIVVFSLLNEEYGLEITSVQEIVRFQEITKIPEAPDFIKGIINLRGQVIPVIDLKQRFYNIKSEITEDTRIVVVKIGTKTIGIIADQVSEVLHIPEEAIEPTPALLNDFNQSGITGVGKLEDRLLILLDLEKTLSRDELKQINKVV
ncbi:MAG: purine-binding chemotaxis protein CheW [Clostridia bacterium]|jgi:purine-binding chemotaxis protein CheW|nr:purine-binding chemotaxis protein CheW [Clostridia bacterium]MDN5322637.1 purine-binding chemotaxis protein CheW [Clostridia bacterium]